MKTTKKQEVIDLVNNDDYKKALSIAKNFVKDFDKAQQRTIQIAYETLCDRDSFYKMMNIDTNKMVEDAKILLNEFVEQKSK